MRRVYILTALFIAFTLVSQSLILEAEARRGCCSGHSGVCGCACCDGTPLSAKCAPYYPNCDNEHVSPPVSTYTQPSNTQQKIKEGFYICTRVVDGDTIVLDGKEKVRLIGVDTPETVHPSKPVEYFGKEASAFTKRVVEGKRVRLEYDWERIDKYGRTLAYVYLEDGTFVNLEIVRQGYGHAYTKYPFKYMEEFRQAERQARENNRGLWK